MPPPAQILEKARGQWSRPGCCVPAGALAFPAPVLSGTVGAIHPSGEVTSSVRVVRGSSRDSRKRNTRTQIAGEAIVNAIDDCPVIADGEGSVITGRFVTRQVDEIAREEIHGADGIIEVLEGTTIHPIWSLDRSDWVPLGELTAVFQRTQPVYNVDVHGEHVYEVGRHGDQRFRVTVHGLWR